VLWPSLWAASQLRPCLVQRMLPSAVQAAALAPPCHQHAETPQCTQARCSSSSSRSSPASSTASCRLGQPGMHGCVCQSARACYLDLAVIRCKAWSPQPRCPLWPPRTINVRHLGILISTADPAAANRAMFVMRLTAVRLHRSWARVSASASATWAGCTLPNRCWLAPCLYFHASFMLPSEDIYPRSGG
jgi:hypothetical protein